MTTLALSLIQTLTSRLLAGLPHGQAVDRSVASVAHLYVGAGRRSREAPVRHREMASVGVTDGTVGG